MKISKLFLAILLSVLGIQTHSSGSNSINQTIKVLAGLTQGLDGDPINNDSHAQNYYASIDSSLTGTNLLSALQKLNSSERTKTVGYGNMWSYYNKTDYDPNDSSKYIAYYRGTSASKGSMNKEHVWPDSRGGGTVDGDIHMPRPTLTSDNSSRGNSFYVEGMCHSSNGWDPYADGMEERYRGDAARIIFYCVVANPSLKLVDKDNDSTSNNSMGKLSDLLKWNLAYPVDDSEIRRNEGAESIQGNRNPFIDDRSLACKIWGDTNETTKNVCRDSMKVEPPTKIEITPSSSTLHIDEKVTLKVKVTPTNASSKVVWSSSDSSVATVNENGEVTGIKEGAATIYAYSSIDNSVSGSAKIQVKAVKSIALSGTASKVIYNEGDKFDPTGINVTVTYNDNTTASLDSNSLTWVDGVTKEKTLSQGTTSVITFLGDVSATYSGIVVNPKPAVEGAVLIENTSELNVGDQVLIANKDSEVVAGELNGKFLNPESTTFSNDGKLIKNYNAAKIYTLGGKEGQWTFTSNNSLLGVLGEKTMTFSGGTTTFDISISSGEATMTSTNASYGSLQYNKSAPRFTTYKSNQQLINLYRLESESATNKSLTGLIVTGELTKSIYIDGEVFSPQGLTIKAIYNDGSQKDVTSLISWPLTPLIKGMSKVTGSYSEDGITKTIDISIIVNDNSFTNECSLSSLLLANSPNKIFYQEGEIFDPTGVIVYAFYSDNSQRDVSSLVIWENKPLTKDMTSVVGQYSENNITKTVVINNIKVLTKISSQGCATTSSSIFIVLSIIGCLMLVIGKKRLGE